MSPLLAAKTLKQLRNRYKYGEKEKNFCEKNKERKMCKMVWGGGVERISCTKANKQILLLIHFGIPSVAPFFLSTPTVKFFSTYFLNIIFYFSLGCLFIFRNIIEL